MKHLIIPVYLFLICQVSALSAEVTEFGGHPARFKGNGDLEPPLCHIEVPGRTNSPFFIQWNCTDNESSPDELRSEVWIVRKNAPIPFKVADFLGFPASVKIEKEHLIDFSLAGSDEEREALRQMPFEEFLPVGIRLLARDRSGTASLSPVITVEPGAGAAISRCSLMMQTRPVPASIDFSGTPGLFADIPSFPVNSLSTISGSRSLRSSQSINFGNCEIDEICPSPASEYQLQLTLQGQNRGTVLLTPARNSSTTFQAQVSGSSDQGNFQMNGTGSLPSGVEAEVTISCE